MEKRYLNVKEAAEYMNCCQNTARKFCKAWGALVKVGRLSRYDLRVIDAVMGRTITIGEDR